MIFSGSTIDLKFKLHVDTVWWEADAVTNKLVFARGYRQGLAEDLGDEGILLVLKVGQCGYDKNVVAYFLDHPVRYIRMRSM